MLDFDALAAQGFQNAFVVDEFTQDGQGLLSCGCEGEVDRVAHSKAHS
jgi:hypothetical protein